MESSTAEFLERQPAFERLSMHPARGLARLGPWPMLEPMAHAVAYFALALGERVSPVSWH